MCDSSFVLFDSFSLFIRVRVDQTAAAAASPLPAPEPAKKVKKEKSKPAKQQQPKPVAPSVQFLRDITVPSGAPHACGTRVLKTWQVKNNGSVSWPEQCKLVSSSASC